MADYYKEAKKAKAARDFQKAGDLYVLGGDNQEAIDCYLQGGLYALAARLYEKAEDFKSAARCFEQAKNYEKAAQLYVSSNDFKRASEMFEKYNDLTRASEMSQKAGDLAQAASLADRAGKLDRAADLYVKVQNYDRAAAIYTELMERYIKERQEDGFLEITVVRIKKYANAAGSLNARLQRYEKAARCFEEAENFPKAAECHARGGRYERAAELFADGEDFANASLNFEKAGKIQKASEMAERAGDHARAAVLAEKSGQIERAAALYVKTDQIQKAADLLFQVVIKGIDQKATNRFADSNRMTQRKTATSAAALYLRLNQPARAAWCFEQAENFGKAAECYEKTQNIQKAGELYLRAGNHAKAYELLTGPGGGDTKPEIMAELYFRMGKFAEAGDLFMVAKNLLRAAESFEKAGNHYKAAVMFEDVQEPARAAALYMELKEYKKAGPLFEKAEKWKEAGQMYEQAGEPEHAINAFKKAGEHLAAAKLMREKDPPQAIAILQEITTDHQDYREACALLGEIYAGAGVDTLAIQKFKEALTQTSPDADNLELYYLLACSYQKLEQYSNAQPIFESILSIDLRFRDALQRLQQVRDRATGETSAVEDDSAIRRAMDTNKLTATTNPAPPAPFPAASSLDMSQQEPVSLVGKKIREYEILEVIGKGGMGSVYRARHIYLDKERAIKVIESKLISTDFANRFIREARILSDLHSPYLVQLYEFGMLDEKQFFMVLELIQGESAKNRIKNLGRIPLRDSLRILREAARGLQVAHEKGIVHRDMSPDNLMLVKDETGTETTKVIDFGIAKPLSEITEGYTSTNMFLGKPEFASPEQCGFLQEGQTIDHRTDIYSLAVTFYCMSAGKLPFYSPTPQGYLVKHLTQEPKPLAEHFAPGELPAELDAVILKALSKNRDKRQATMAELLKELEPVLL